MKAILTLLAVSMLSGIPALAFPASSPSVNVEEKTQPAETTVIFSADIHCDGCKKKIEKNIAFEKGVKEIKVDINSKTVSVTFKTTKNTPEKLSQALTKLGYKNEIKIVK